MRERTHDPLDAADTASRALLGILSRSVAEALEIISLAQYRVMSSLAERALSAEEVAEIYGPSAISLMELLNELVETGWAQVANASSRHAPHYELTAHGHQLIAHVAVKRRTELTVILESLPASDRDDVARALSLFADAAEEFGYSDISHPSAR